MNLRELARRAMLDHGFLVELPADARRQLALETPVPPRAPGMRDLTSWYWSSIDNDESRDLDQLEYAVGEAAEIRLYVAIADVDLLVPAETPLDSAARHNTVSVYTGVQVFPMLPERLSTDLSSLGQDEGRAAVVIEMLVNEAGEVLESSVYPALVRNHARLTYDGVTAWLDGQSAPAPEAGQQSEATALTLEKIHSSRELQDQLRLQNTAAEALRRKRHERGALSFQTFDLQPRVAPDGTVIELKTRGPSRAGNLIEDLMVAANQATAQMLEQKGLPGLHRVVESPRNWDRIAALAREHGFELPPSPDAPSLEAFLRSQADSEPENFAELSTSVIKLLGRGRYRVKVAGVPSPGHFALAVRGYSHSTAPNRRYPDLVMQRLLKAAGKGLPSPYSIAELTQLAEHCTEREDQAVKVERHVKKCIAATVLRDRIGEKFKGIITGASEKGTWVRIRHPLVEGRLHGAVKDLQVGERVRVRLQSTDPQKGFIDFVLLG